MRIPETLRSGPAASTRQSSAASTLEALLALMEARDASDLYLKPGAPPLLRVAGDLVSAGEAPLGADDIWSLADVMMTDRHRAEFAAQRRTDVAYTAAGNGRYRANIYLQRGTPAAVIRRIRIQTQSFESLRLPRVLERLALAPRGLVLVTGQAGSGKSTTLATMVSYRSRERTGHIVTIEDPIEFLHEDARSIISQREVGTDVDSFGAAFRDAMRQSPDVILIGEIRDEESATAAVHFAETGHLVLSSLHATNASQALERLLHFLPPERHAGLSLQLSLNLLGVVSQRLLPRAQGRPVVAEGRPATAEAGLVVAVEILAATPRVRELLRKADLGALRGVMESSAGIQEGMQTFDHAIYELIQAGLVDVEAGLTAAESPNDLRLRLRGLR